MPNRRKSRQTKGNKNNVKSDKPTQIKIDRRGEYEVFFLNSFMGDKNHAQTINFKILILVFQRLWI